MRPFTLLIKPSGSDCNIDCKYCFYKDRAPEFGKGRQQMSDEVLEKFVKDYMRLGFPVSGFAQQGGEPTLMDRDFFRRANESHRESCFCESYKRFFDYTMPRSMQVVAAINAGSPVKTQPFV